MAVQSQVGLYLQGHILISTRKTLPVPSRVSFCQFSTQI